MRISQTSDEFACKGDDPELQSLAAHSDVGTTAETRHDLTAEIAMGLASCRADIEPERNP